MTTDERDSLGVIAEKLAGVVRSQDRMQRDIDGLRSHLDGRLDALTFVSQGTYDEGRKTIDVQIAEVRGIAIGARTLAMWAIGLMVTAAITTLVVLQGALR